VWKKDSDILFVTNGSGYLFETEITWLPIVSVPLRIISFEETSFKISFASCSTDKMNDRYEWFLESNRIGVNESTPTYLRTVLNENNQSALINYFVRMKRANSYIYNEMKPLLLVLKRESERFGVAYYEGR
jgi:hypothetical protein